MKEFSIYPLGEDLPITVKGNYSSYIRDLQKGVWSHYVFPIVYIPEFLSMRLVTLSSSRNCNHGLWVVHHQGYNCNLTYRKDGFIEVNTYWRYRRVVRSREQLKKEGFI